MVTLQRAREIVFGEARATEREPVALEAALGRVLARDVVSDIDVPPGDMSALDGFACRREDVGRRLRVVGAVSAGEAPSVGVGPGECTRIMTGAQVPPGADTVVRFERAVEKDGWATPESSGGKSNIRRRGEDIRAGSVVIPEGTLVTPAVTAVLASVGCARPQVRRRPVVGVIATGDELVEPEERPEGPCIRNSAGVMLRSQVTDAGCRAEYYGIAADTPEALDALLREAMGEADVILLSGGVSMGDHDHVPEVLAEVGVRTLFRQVALKPGRPTVFGVASDRYLFGLPGNPVAAFVIFEVLVRPFLYRLMGADHQRRRVGMRLAEAYSRRRSSRTELRPVRLCGGDQAAVLEYHGSAHIRALAGADGLAVIPEGVGEMPAGSAVEVILLR